jgi:hypothetical protein
MRYAIVPFLLALLSPSLACADYAFIVTKGICDNQGVNFSPIWAQHKFPGNKQVLFYFDGHDFKPAGHTEKLDTFSIVYISDHGGIGTIAGIKADVFASTFRNSHKSVPHEVHFMACNSAVAPSAGRSVVGALADAYPVSTSTKDTEIATLTGATGSCALAKPASVPISKIADAILYVNVQRTTKGQTLIGELQKGWTSDDYPGQKGTNFKKYCETVVLNKPETLPAFLGEVDKMYGAKYLALINENSAGTPLITCGKSQQQKMCP